MLPLLQGKIDIPVRDYAIHHSMRGNFAVRKKNWVFINATSGDDNEEPEWFKKEREYTPHNCPGELFNLDADLAERKNLYNDYPEIVQELSQLLNQVKPENAKERPSSPNISFDSE